VWQGFDAQPGTLEHRLVKDGYRRMLALRELLPVPCVPVGTISSSILDEFVGYLHTHRADVYINNRRIHGGLEPGAVHQAERCGS